MSLSTPSPRSLTRMARLLRDTRTFSTCTRCLATTSSSISSSRTTALPPLPSKIRSPYRVLHDPPFDSTHHQIKTYPPPPSVAAKYKEPIDAYNASQIALLDPSSTRKNLFSEANPDGIRVGDMLHCVFTSGTIFNGIVLSLSSLRTPDAFMLLRNRLEQTGVELQVRIFSPTLRSVEVVKRAREWMRRGRRPRRAKLYYLGVRRDEEKMVNVEAEVREYLKRRKALMGKGLGKGDISVALARAAGGSGKKRR